MSSQTVIFKDLYTKNNFLIELQVLEEKVEELHLLSFFHFFATTHSNIQIPWDPETACCDCCSHLVKYRISICFGATLNQSSEMHNGICKHANVVCVCYSIISHKCSSRQPDLNHYTQSLWPVTSRLQVKGFSLILQNKRNHLESFKQHIYTIQLIPMLI